MSNYSAHRPASYKAESFIPRDHDWEEEDLFKGTAYANSFGETDWTQVPKIDFADAGFTQLSLPESAQVDDDDSEFKLDDLDTLKQLGDVHLPSDVSGGVKRVARALTLEMEKPKYRYKDLTKTELLSREKLKNPQAKSNADQPFIPSYGESRRALLKKLGFSDDYELSLSGKASKSHTGVADYTFKDEEEEQHDFAQSDAASHESIQEQSKAESEILFNPLTDSELRGEKPQTALGDAADQDAEPQLSRENQNDQAVDHEQFKDQSLAGEEISEDLAGDASLGEGTLNSSDSLSAREDHATQIENQLSDSVSDFADQPSDLMQSQVQEQIAKAYQEGLERGAEQVREKAQVQESLKDEMALKEKQTMAEQYAEQERLLQTQREKERAEYEQEIQTLKDKIKSFDESLLGELEKKKQQLEAQMQPRVELMTQLCDQLQALTQDAQSCFEPLKRLSVHIAEQLVLGELSVSSSAVERLIRRCTDDLDVRDAAVIKVEINALDKVTLEKTLPPSMKAIELRVSPDLQVGSVRVLVNDTQVEDLIQNRLDAMASRLLGQPKLWREESTLMKEPITEAYFQSEPELLEPIAQPPGAAGDDSSALIQSDEHLGVQASEQSPSSIEAIEPSETTESVDLSETRESLEPKEGV